MADNQKAKTVLDHILETARVGWNPWPGTAIGPVLLDKDWRHPVRGYGTDSFWGVVGSRSVVTAWSGMAIANGALWISNGGHADYGGNEWYRFDLGKGEWERKTHPSRLVEGIRIPKDDGSTFMLPVPDDGRALRGHVYGSPVQLPDGRILTVNPVPFARGHMYFDEHVQNAWIFDPETLEEKPAPLDFNGMGGCARLGNGNILFATNGGNMVLDPALSRILSQSKGGLGFACGYDPGVRMAVGGIWAPKLGVATLDPSESRVFSYKSVDAPVRLTYAGVLPCGDGVFALFGEGGEVWLFDAIRERWQQHTYPHAPDTRRLCNKIQWLPGRKAAVCIPHDVNQPVHVFVPDFQVK